MAYNEGVFGEFLEEAFRGSAVNEEVERLDGGQQSAEGQKREY